MNAERRILLVEDDPRVAKVLRLTLHNEGYAVEHASDGDAGARLAQRHPWLAMVMHLTLPGVSGLEITRIVRAMEHYTPIIVSNARSSEMQRILALETGADDVLARPFSVPELVARLRALLRRSDAMARQSGLVSSSLQIDGLFIEPRAREVQLDGEPVSLTPREFDLLHFLARHPSTVYSRLDLLHQVWGYTHGGYEHTVNTHINRLRLKVESCPAEPRRIVTVWGRGYKLASPLRAAKAAQHTACNDRAA